MYVFYIKHSSIWNNVKGEWSQRYWCVCINKPHPKAVAMEYTGRQVFMVPGTVDPMED